jgi:hypothetical protein
MRDEIGGVNPSIFAALLQANGVRVEIRGRERCGLYHGRGRCLHDRRHPGVHPPAHDSAAKAKAELWNWLMQPMFGRREASRW